MAEVEFEANGSKATGYLAEPEGEGPGLVVLQEWWGVEAMNMDEAEKEMRGAVDYVATHPKMPHGKPDFSKPEGTPVLGHFGDNDDFISTDGANALQDELNQAGAHFYEVPGTRSSTTSTGSGPTIPSTRRTPGTARSTSSSATWTGAIPRSSGSSRQ
jgi:dienelactone hydrolase